MQELAEQFEQHRGQLRAVAYRMLGSAAEAEDAVQEAWLRLSRTTDVENLPAWLRTVVSRICLDMLRARREDPVGQQLPEQVWDGDDPEDSALRAESVSRALLVVLNKLSPAERTAFVLHDMFAVPFGEIAAIVGRTQVAAKKLASRARQRVHGTPTLPAPELTQHQQIVEAFLAAARNGDMTALLAVLAPDVVRTADPVTLPPGHPVEVRGAHIVARGTVGLGRRSQFAEIALVDGAVGVVVAPRGQLAIVLTVSIAGNRIAGYDVIADPARLRQLSLAVLDPTGPHNSCPE